MYSHTFLHGTDDTYNTVCRLNYTFSTSFHFLWGTSMQWIRFIEKHHGEIDPDEYDPTCDDHVQCVIDDQPALLTVQIPSDEGLPPVVYMRHCDGFLLVYSITSRRSFDDIDEYRQQILRVKEFLLLKDLDYFPMVLVGTNWDKEEEEENDRVVSFSEGREMAKRLGSTFRDCARA